MVKQFVSFERLSQYDSLIKQFIKNAIDSSDSQISDLKSLIEELNGEGENSVKAQISKALDEFINADGATEAIDSYKEVIEYVNAHGKEFSDLVDTYNELAKEVGKEATDKEPASGLYAKINEVAEDLKSLEISASSDEEGAIVATLSGTVSQPEISLTYEFCTEEDVNELFALKTVKIGNKEYSSIAKALNNLENGDTLTLTENINLSEVNAITVNGEATIDLNGKEIKAADSQVVYVAVPSEEISTYSLAAAQLTLTGNGTITGPEGSVGASKDGKSVMTVEGKNATLIVLDGTYTSGGEGSDGMYGIYALDGANVVLGDEQTKTGPVITSWFAAIGENNTTAPANISIYGGIYTAQATPADTDWWSYFCAPVYAAASGNINIYGGEFNGYYGLSTRYSNVAQNINIYGGTFNGSKKALFVDTKQGSGLSGTRSINIYGGIFSSDITEWCAPGYTCIPSENGMFKVVASN